MNRTELEAAIVEKTGVSRKDVGAVLTAFVESVEGALKAGDDVRLVGFGTFGVKSTPAKEGRNPRTGEKMQIAAKKQPKFAAGKGLKDALNA